MTRLDLTNTRQRYKHSLSVLGNDLMLSLEKIESWTINNVSSQTYKGRKSFKNTHVLFKTPTEVLVKYLSLGSRGSNFGKMDNIWTICTTLAEGGIHID